MIRFTERSGKQNEQKQCLKLNICRKINYSSDEAETSLTFYQTFVDIAMVGGWRFGNVNNLHNML